MEKEEKELKVEQENVHGDNVVSEEIPQKAPVKEEQPENVFDFLYRTSGKRFYDISVEKARTYTFPSGEELTIESPVALHVSESGGHRVLNMQGRAYYVQPKEGWSITWTVPAGAPFFLNM